MSELLPSNKSDSEGLTLSGNHQLSDCKANGSALPSTPWNTLPKHWKPGSIDSPVHTPTVAPASSSPGKSKTKKPSSSGKSAAVDGAVRSVGGKQHKGRRAATPDGSLGSHLSGGGKHRKVVGYASDGNLGGHQSGGGKHRKAVGYTSDGSVSPSSAGGQHRKALNHPPVQPAHIDNSSLCEPETRKVSCPQVVFAFSHRLYSV